MIYKLFSGMTTGKTDKRGKVESWISCVGDIYMLRKSIYDCEWMNES